MTQPLKNVVVAVDLDETADAVWDMALGLDLDKDATLHVCHVASAKDTDVRRHTDDVAKTIQVAHDALQAFLQKRLGDEKNPLCSRVDVQIAVGPAADQIIQLAVDVSADLIVLGTREKKGLTRLFLGSVSTEVFRQAPCSVLVARKSDYEELDKAPAVEAALVEGQGTMRPVGRLVRYRSRPFSTYNANLFPTGIPRKQVY